MPLQTVQARSTASIDDSAMESNRTGGPAPASLARNSTPARLAEYFAQAEPIWTASDKSPITIVHTWSMYARQFIPGLINQPAAAAAGLAMRMGFAATVPWLARQAITKLEARLARDFPEYGGFAEQYGAACLRALRVGLCWEAEVPGMAAAIAMHWLMQSIPETRPKVRWTAQHLLAPIITSAVKEAAFQGYFQHQHARPQEPLPDVAGTCNGSVRGCDKTLNHFTFAATHNSLAGEKPFADPHALSVFPLNQLGRFVSNQDTSLDQQWNAGIRGFLWGVKQQGNTLLSAHIPDFVYGPFEAPARALAQLLHKHPNSIAMLQLEGESAVDSTLLARTFNHSGLGAFMNPGSLSDSGCYDAYDNNITQATIGTLIAQGKRLIWNCESSYSENLFDVRTLSDVACDPAHMYAAGGVWFTWNMFTLPLARNSAVINKYLLPKLTQCLAEGGVQPTLIAVNHFESSNVVAAALSLNEGP